MKFNIDNKVDLIPYFVFLDILILILTALIRTQYILFHIAEIIFLVIVIFVIIREKKPELEEGNRLLFSLTSLLSFSVMWLGGIIILNSVQHELERDVFYAILLIIFLITVLIFIFTSLTELYTKWSLIKSSFPVLLLIWFVTAILFLLTTFLLAPTEDITNLMTRFDNLL